MFNEASGVRILLVLTIGSYLLAAGASDEVILNFALWPLQADFMPWQLLTYAFLHGSVMHIAFNMYGLWLFGTEIESLVGRKAFLQLYFASVVSAALMQILVTSMTGNVYPTVGASGGVFGLLLAYGIFFPKRKLMLLIPPIPMPAWLFVTLYAVLELTLGVTGSQQGVAHFAHLGGMVGGFLVINHWRNRVRNNGP